MKNYILVLDAGTTSIKGLLFNRQLDLVAMSTKKIEATYPGPRMVEQDPETIYALTVEAGREALQKAGVGAEEIAAAAITNQRTSWTFWDEETQKPLCKLITWQDTRGVDYLKPLFIDNEAFNEMFPGLGEFLPPIYTPVSVASTMQIHPELAEALKKPGIKWGNVDSWLLFKLTGGKSFATAYSTASASSMLDTPSGTWATFIAEFIGMRPEMFPEIREENSDFGMIQAEVFGAEIPIYGMIADQQAAMFAQGCFTPTTAKCTNGSGTFVNINIGETYEQFGDFFTFIAWKLEGTISYMFEANSFTTGSCLELAREQLELFGSTEQLTADAESVADSNGVYFVPALGGLTGAPYHDASARASFMGIGPDSTRKHLTRAVLESVAYSASSLIDTIRELGVNLETLSVSGGVSSSDLVVQLMANLLNMEVNRPATVEATGAGAALIAATRLGWKTLEECKSGMEAETSFHPNDSQTRSKKDYAMWKKAVERSMHWLESEPS